MRIAVIIFAAIFALAACGDGSPTSMVQDPAVAEAPSQAAALEAQADALLAQAEGNEDIWELVARAYTLLAQAARIRAEAAENDEAAEAWNVAAAAAEAHAAVAAALSVEGKNTGLITRPEIVGSDNTNVALQAPIVHYGHPSHRWTTIGISPLRGLQASVTHLPSGYEIAYGTASNEGIDVAWAKTREQQALRFRQAADELERYVRAFHSDLLTTFDAQPIVRIDQENPEWAKIALTAIQSINTALPDRFKMHVVDRGDGEVQDGEIVIDFHPKALWPTPSYGRTAGRTEFPVLEWIPGDRANSKYGAHVWIDTGYMAGASARHARALIAHEIMHALGLHAHLESPEFPATIMQSVINTGEDTPKQSLYSVDRLGLFAVYSGLGPEDLGDWGRDAVRIEAYMLGQDSTQFGVTSMNGLTSSWASIRENTDDFGAWASRSASGSATWSGRVLGLTPQIAAVSGLASLTLDLSDLDGTLAFTELETWGPGAPLGEDGSGSVWGDGDLRYSIVMHGSTFRQTGGDDGIVTGAFGGQDFSTMGGVVDRHDLDAAFSGRR